jgi:HK97 family phage major capsid protein
MNQRELLDKRSSLMAEAAKLLDAGIETDEARTAYNAKLAEVDAVDAKLGDGNALQQRQEKLAAIKTTPGIGMSDKEKRQYSLLRAINAQIKKDWSGAGLELEASKAVVAARGREVVGDGFAVPFEALNVQKRTGLLTAGTNADGGYTVATDLLAAEFIDVLRNKMVMFRAGARVLGGLVGNIAIPRQTGATTSYWVAENTAPTTNKPQFDQVTLNPATLGAYTDLSRRLLLQSSIDVEAMVREDIATVIAIEMDRAGLHGSGSGSEPQGVINISGVGSGGEGGTNGAAPTYDTVLAMESDVAVANAEQGRLAYITNPKIRKLYKKTFTNATYGEIPVWNDLRQDNADGSLNGYAAFVTNQVSHALTKGSGSALSAIFYGDWTQAIYGIWGAGLDMLVDPYTGSSAGTVRIVALQDTQFNVRHPGAFSVVKSAIAA